MINNQALVFTSDVAHVIHCHFPHLPLDGESVR